MDLESQSKIQPVFFVDSCGIIVSANNDAAKFCGLNSSELSGYCLGEALSCMNAELPEGCSNTLGCQLCTLRKCVLQSLKLNEVCVDVPFLIDVKKADVIEQKMFSISTSKSDNMVKLLIKL